MTSNIESKLDKALDALNQNSYSRGFGGGGFRGPGLGWGLGLGLGALGGAVALNEIENSYPRNVYVVPQSAPPAPTPPTTPTRRGKLISKKVMVDGVETLMVSRDGKNWEMVEQ